MTLEKYVEHLNKLLEENQHLKDLIVVERYMQDFIEVDAPKVFIGYFNKDVNWFSDNETYIVNDDLINAILIEHEDD